MCALQVFIGALTLSKAKYTALGLYSSFSKGESAPRHFLLGKEHFKGIKAMTGGGGHGGNRICCPLQV